MTSCAWVVAAGLWVAAAPPEQLQDHRLVAVDARTGELRWKTLFNRLANPVVTVQHGVAWAAPSQGVAAGQRHGFDARSGGPPPPVDETAAGAVASPVAWEVPVRVDGDGAPLLEGKGGAQRVRLGGAPRALEAGVLDAQRAGSRVVLLWEPGANLGSHVVAVDADGLLAWELDLARAVPGFVDGAPVAIHAMPDVVTVVADHHVLLVNAANGNVTGTTVVKTQVPLVEAGDGCRVARGSGAITLGCRHGLVRLDAAGAFLFFVDTGAQSWPNPTNFEDLLIMGARDERPPTAAAISKARDRPALFLLLVKDASWLGGYRPEFVRAADNARKDRVLWSLAQPPGPDSTHVVHVHAGTGADARIIQVDVGDALQKHGRALVRVPANTRKMALMEGTRQILSATR